MRQLLELSTIYLFIYSLGNVRIVSQSLSISRCCFAPNYNCSFGMPFITKRIYAMHKYLLCVAVFHVSSWDAFYHQTDIRHAQILALRRCVSCIVMGCLLLPNRYTPCTNTCFASLCFMYRHGMPFITKQIYAMHRYRE